MSDSTTYLITGSNKGIGHALVSQLVQRPHTTVIAVYRASSSPQSPFSALNLHHPTSTLIPVPLSVYPIPSTSHLLSLIPHPITRLDCVIANAGGTSGFRDVRSTTAEDMRYDFELNAVGPAELFRVCWPLMKVEEEAEEGKGSRGGGKSAAGRKFVLVSSSVGSIGGLEEESFPAVAYGMSKAASNWWARKVAVDYRDKGLVVGVLHPGWVKTGMGEGIADALGIEGVGPGTTAEESARGLLVQIDGLTLENSGEFRTYDGKTLPW